MNRHLFIDLEDLTVTIRRGTFQQCHNKDNPGRTYNPRIPWLFWFIQRYCSRTPKGIGWHTIVPNAGGPDVPQYPVQT